MSALYRLGDLVWCIRCERAESAGAVLHDGPYTSENSRPLPSRDPDAAAKQNGAGT